MDGVVVAATDTTLLLHPPIGADVTLNLTEDTRFQQVGSHTADTAPPHPLAGQYARARYDRNTLIAAQVVLTPPVPLPAVGLVGDTSPSGFSLTLRDGRILSLAVNANTVFRINGRPGSSTELATGDRAEVLFLLEGTANRALRVNVQLAPPRSFQGVVTTNGGSTLSAKGRGGALSFQVDAHTAIRLNGKPVTLVELQPNQPVEVLYRARNGGLWALRVNARSVKPTAPTSTGGHGKSQDRGKG
jgi:hypothetical protein